MSTLDSSPAIFDEATPVRCVGIYYVNISSDWKSISSLTDTGMRFYIDPVTQELDSWGYLNAENDEAQGWLAGLSSIPETAGMTADQFLTWCLGYASANGYLGSSRTFRDPHMMTPERLSGPDNVDVARQCAEFGM